MRAGVPRLWRPNEMTENTDMRLTPAQIQAIRQTTHRVLGEEAAIWLFGSRVDDSKRGGDVDLYVESASLGLLNEIRCKVHLQDILDLPVDLVVRAPHDGSVIARHAREQGVRL